LTRTGAGAVDNLISGVTTSWFATTIWGMLLSIALLIFEVEIPSMRMKTERGMETRGRDLQGVHDGRKAWKSPANSNKA